MTFAAPLFLLAALAGLIPVLLHLIHRQKAREVPFQHAAVPADQRPADPAAEVRRGHVAAGRAGGRAALDRAGAGAAGDLRPGRLWGRGRAAAIAIVLDNSASMAMIDGGRPRFETARQGGRAGARPAARGRPGGPAADRRPARPGARAALSHS